MCNSRLVDKPGGEPASAERYCTKLKCVRKQLIIKEILVEATGVEPASENVTGQETTCLFRFMPQSLGLAAQPGTFAADAQNGQETQAASLKVSSSCPDVAGKTSPLYDVLTAAHGRSRGGRQLN
jgi:hypothetical protein